MRPPGEPLGLRASPMALSRSPRAGDCPPRETPQFVVFRQPRRNSLEYGVHRWGRGHQRAIGSRDIGDEDPLLGVDNRVGEAEDRALKPPWGRARHAG